MLAVPPSGARLQRVSTCFLAENKAFATRLYTDTDLKKL